MQIQYHGLTEEQRFFKRVNVGAPDECWEWTGSRNQKQWHGQWRNKSGQIELTHRAAWRMFKCEIPPGMFVLHKCDNPICVNPSHLWLGTQSENCKDMWSKGRARPKSSIGEKHGMSKVNESIVREIRSSSLSGVELARQFGITTTTVCDIRKRRSWKHIK